MRLLVDNFIRERVGDIDCQFVQCALSTDVIMPYIFNLINTFGTQIDEALGGCKQKRVEKIKLGWSEIETS